MGKLYQGNSGKIYCIEESKIAGGGEGGIYLIQQNKTQVAKIFKPERRTEQREKKLRHMVRQQLNEDQLKQITWPQDVIYDLNGFAGYIMPKLKYSTSMTEIYSTEKYDLRYRLLVAVNLCAAIDTVHAMGQVCGDLNPQNICVNLDVNDKENAFQVTLVDTDSYHFSTKDITYRCEVGLGDYIAPELQKKMQGGLNLKTVSLPSYTRETDLFALAVHIFCLLMNGCHPFACAKEKSPDMSNMDQMRMGVVKNSVVVPQPVENIVDGFFPFYYRRNGICTPIYAPEFHSLPKKIRDLFIKTFVDGYTDSSKRVSASEWKQALSAVYKNLIQCSVKEMHYYFNHETDCPWCRIDKKINSIFLSNNIPDNVQPVSREDNLYYNFAHYTSKKTKVRRKLNLGLILLMVLTAFLVLSVLAVIAAGAVSY